MNDDLPSMLAKLERHKADHRERQFWYGTPLDSPLKNLILLILVVALFIWFFLT